MAIQTDTLAVTATTGSSTFSPDVDIVTLKNVGGNGCYINFDAAATTSHFLLDPQEELVIGIRALGAVHAICDTGLTTSLSIIGTYDIIGV